MIVLVLGGNGMAGHMVVNYLKMDPSIEVHFTTRNDHPESIKCDATDFKQLHDIIKELKPNFIINCIGILNKAADQELYNAIVLNSLLPHYLTKELDRYGGKLIHISTDCVFSGSTGNYHENDLKDGQTNYAKTKALGEVNQAPHLTIRTSIIGPETKNNGIGLLHWFFKQTGTIKGYQQVWWNGVTTLELARFIRYAMEQQITGLCHLTAKEPINKYDLLVLFKSCFLKDDVEIHPDNEISSNKTLVNTRQDIHYEMKDYPKMLEELRDWMSQYE